MDFRCYISGSTFSKEVFPFNIHDIARKAKKKDNEIYIRFELTEDLHFTNYPAENIDDATFLYNWVNGNSDISRDERLTLLIKQVDNGVEKDWWTGTFRFYDLKVTTDNTHYIDVVLKPDLQDDYTIFDNNKNKDFNIISGLTRNSVGIDYYTDVEFIITESSSPPDSTWKLFKMVLYLPAAGFSPDHNRWIYAREYVSIPRLQTPSGTGWTDLSEQYDDIHKWVRHWDTGFSGIANYIVIKKYLIFQEIYTNYNDTTAEFDFYRDKQIIFEGGIPGGWIVYLYNDYYYSLRVSISLNYSIGYTLKDSLQKLISYIDPTRTVMSSFLFNDNDEDGNTYYDNYVLNDGSLNKLTKSYLIDKRDFKRPNASQLTSIANVKLEDINKDLFTLFQIFPFIDKQGNYRYEHINYWQRQLGINLKTNHDEFINDKYSFDFDKVKFPNREKFTPIEAGSTDFLENSINYDNIAPVDYEENTEEFTTKILYTDVDYILRNLENTSDEGFVLVLLDDDDNIKVSTGVLSGYDVQNAYLSFANLIPLYWPYNRPYLKGYINGVLTEFTMKKIKQGEEIEIVSKEDIDPEKLVETYMGQGEVDELTEYLDGRKKIKLLYNL